MHGSAIVHVAACFLIVYAIYCCSGNVDDALEKLQEIFDAAWKAVQPIEEDPEKKKKLEKQVERGKQERLQAKKMQSDKKKERRAKIEW